MRSYELVVCDHAFPCRLLTRRNWIRDHKMRREDLLPEQISELDTASKRANVVTGSISESNNEEADGLFGSLVPNQ